MPLGNFTNIAVSTSLLFLEELPHTTTCKINYYFKKNLNLKIIKMVMIIHKQLIKIIWSIRIRKTFSFMALI